MFRIGLCLGMAGRTGKHGVVTGIDVAVIARHPLASMCAAVDRKPGMREDGTQPSRSVVAGAARRRKVRRDVIWIGSARKVSLVAGVAVSRRALISTVDVALGTGKVDVCSGEGKPRFAVIKLRSLPTICRMTDLAIRRETSLYYGWDRWCRCSPSGDRRHTWSAGR
jgi:hypothetical protein